MPLPPTTAAGRALYGRRMQVTIYRPLAGPSPTPGAAGIGQLLQITGEGDPATPGLRMRCRIMKTLEKEPNTCELTISGLSDATRSALQTKGVNVLIEAGYQATGITGLYTGDVRTIDHERRGATWDTVMKLGDGDRFFRFNRVNVGFSPGVTAGTVLSALASATGYKLGNVAAIAASLTQVFANGYAATGSAQRALDMFIRSIGYTWSIQNGALQILAPTQVVGASIPLISPSTGLIGSPQMGTPEQVGQPALCKFTSLLIPVRLGGVVHLTSERYNSDLVVRKAEFDLDTSALDWYITIYGAFTSQ